MKLSKLKKRVWPFVLSIDMLRYIYAFFYKKKLVKRKIKKISEINASYLIKNGEICDVFSPNIDGFEKHKKVVSPDIKIYIFENVVGSINSSCFYDDDNAYFDEIFSIHRADANYASGSLIFHNKKNAIFNIKKEIIINENCFFLGGNASFNYYHWLIEILPKILFVNKEIIKKYKIKAIVLNDKVKEISSFMLSFAAVAGDHNLKIIFCSENDDLKFKKIIYLSSFNSVLLNSNKNTVKLEDVVFSKSSLDILRNRVFSNKYFLNIEESKVSFPKKIFLMRGKVSGYNKRNYNENEVFEFFKDKGFEAVYAEKYSFFEQAYLFSNAEQIIGPSGAFWTNLIFSSPGVIALSWLPNSYKDFSVYSTIAKFYKVKMIFHIYNSSNELHEAYNIKVDLLWKSYKASVTI